MIILGIDPGLVNTGWGIIEVQGNKLTYIADGTIKPRPTDTDTKRLFHIYTELKKVIETYKPEVSGIEDSFVSRFPKSTLKLGLARGVAMLTPSIFGIELNEYSPTLVKKAITGTGSAPKEQIEMMVKTLLGIKGTLSSEHSSDALGIAIATSFYSKNKF